MTIAVDWDINHQSKQTFYRVNNKGADQTVQMRRLFFVVPMQQRKTDINEYIQPSVDCEMVTNNSAIFITNFGDYFVRFMQL